MNIEPPNIKRHSMYLILVFSIVLIISLTGLVTISQTEVGVVEKMGKVQDTELGAGWHVVPPIITKVHKYPVTKQNFDIETKPLTSEGLEYTLQVSVFYQLIPNKASDVYLNYKYSYEDFLKRIVVDSLKRNSRMFTAEQLATQEGVSKLMESTYSEINPKFEEMGFKLISVNIINIDLPDEIDEAIKKKIEAKQEAERYQYLLQKEKLEAERKKIEAQGIAEANKIIAESIDENYIKWYYMQTLQQFAESQNNAIIIVPVPGNYYQDVNLTEPIQPPALIQTTNNG